jgi:deaminated glutathione amidase
VQVDSNDDEARNWERMRTLAARARDRGAELVCFPENALWEGTAPRRHALEEWEPRLAGLARELGVTLASGSIREPAPDGRAWNTSLVHGPDGARLGRYRKLHLFDVDVPGGPCERESEQIAPGEEVVTVEVPGLGTVGLTICYDLRFPELFRALVDKGARAVLVPSSFALMTGKDHWQVLLRARAIENQVHVIAAGQWGKKPGGRVRFGQSLIADPWGSVLACARDQAEDVVVSELDLAHQDQVRRGLPCLRHRRLK